MWDRIFVCDQIILGDCGVLLEDKVRNFITANEYFLSVFGQKVYKIALDGGMSCPNRTADKKGGCIFCSSGGSGEFAQKQCDSVPEQISNAIRLVESKKPNWDDLYESILE